MGVTHKTQTIFLFLSDLPQMLSQFFEQMEAESLT